MGRGRGKNVGEVLDMSYHRNGVSGRGFWTVIFKGHDRADALVAGHTFVATFFTKESYDVEECPTGCGRPDYDPECIAILRLGDLNESNAEQAWRGDAFHDEIRALTETFVWRFDRQEGVKYDGAGREFNRRREAIEATKAKRT